MDQRSPFSVALITSMAFHSTIGLGLILAMLGQFHGTSVFILVAVVGIACTAFLARQGSFRRLPKYLGTQPLTIFFASIFAAAYFYFLSRGVNYQYQLARDSGGYFTTALNLRANGTLRPPLVHLFEGRSVLHGNSAVFVENGRQEFQWPHGAAVGYAIGSFYVGVQWMVTTAWLGAGLAATHMRRILLHFRCNNVLATTAPMIFFLGLPLVDNLRTTYSEIFVLASALAAFDALTSTKPASDFSYFLAFGLFLGFSTLYRVDSVFFVALCLGGITLTDLHQLTWARRLALATPAATLFFLSFVDLTLFSTAYVDRLGYRYNFGVVLFVVCVGLVLLPNQPRTFSLSIAGAVARVLRPKIVAVAAASVCALLLLLPLFWQSTGRALNYVAAIEARDGLNGDGTRRYNELNSRSIPWYWGNIWFILFPLSSGIVFYSVINRARAYFYIFLGIYCWGFLYIVNKRITPDHLFATRRWIPGFFPIVICVGVLAMSIIVERLPRFKKEASLVAASLLLWTPAVGALSLSTLSVEYGGLELLRRVCHELPAGASVIVTTEIRLMAPTVEFGCGVGAGWLEDDSPRDIVRLSTPERPLATRVQNKDKVAVLTSDSDASWRFPSLKMTQLAEIKLDISDGHYATLNRKVEEAKVDRQVSLFIYELDVPEAFRVDGERFGLALQELD